MIIRQRLPVRHQYLLKNIGLDLCIHLHADIGGNIIGDQVHDHRANAEADDCRKGCEQFPAVSPGNDIHQILGKPTGNQRNDGPGKPKQGIKNHRRPIFPGVLIDPQCLLPHLLQPPGFDSADIKLYPFLQMLHINPCK